MTINEYMDKNGMTGKWLCKQLGISYSSLFKIINGGKVGKLIAQRVEQFTKGQVKYEDLIKLSLPKSEK